LREKRQHQRAELVTTISVESQDELVWKTQSRDISLGGMFLDGASPVPIGIEVYLRFEMPGLGEVRLPGFVRWNTRDGFGIQFGLIGARITHAIGAMILHAPR
jgi:PilZ domain